MYPRRPLRVLKSEFVRQYPSTLGCPDSRAPHMCGCRSCIFLRANVEAKVDVGIGVGYV